MTSKRKVWSWTDAVASASVPPLTKFVCLNISRYLSSAGRGWIISIEQMIEDTGLSNRAIADHLQNAVDAKLLTIKRLHNKQGHRTGTKYFPRFPDDVELSNEPARMADDEGPSEPDSSGPESPNDGASSREGGLSEPGSRHKETSHLSYFPEDTPLPPRGACPPSDALKAFEAYNATALRCGLPQASRLTPDRQRKIIARLREYGLDGWLRALANLEKSAFLTGKNDKGFRADLEFVCQAKSFSRLHDGGYGNSAGHASRPRMPSRFGVGA